MSFIKVNRRYGETVQLRHPLEKLKLSGVVYSQLYLWRVTAPWVISGRSRLDSALNSARVAALAQGHCGLWFCTCPSCIPIGRGGSCQNREGV